MTTKGELCAPHVIVTASVGVLKAGTILFEPPLPKWKVDAFQRVEMTSYCKVFVAWDAQWWTLKT